MCGVYQVTAVLLSPRTPARIKMIAVGINSWTRTRNPQVSKLGYVFAYISMRANCQHTQKHPNGNKARHITNSKFSHVLLVSRNARSGDVCCCLSQKFQRSIRLAW